ncbi:hypothetical protein TeGR_g13447 [Tetraparma gracilis]|uniref:Uncharacterized protein n=1 Tax=Tetraparma gracilis TaxID=2962635 RepID=A0ABQ6MRR2_9STRA|nr:hypothetical protein TeGR_g13447 [Tetraparma gracilis]
MLAPLLPLPASAKTSGVATSQYQTRGAGASALKKFSAADAAANIRTARADLAACRPLLSRKSYGPLLAQIRASAPLKEFEASATSLLSSPRLDADDKKAIGTIRRW